MAMYRDKTNSYLYKTSTDNNNDHGDNDSCNRSTYDLPSEQNINHRCENNSGYKEYDDLHLTSVYETLDKPFKYDKDRGRWAMTCDFYFASCNFAFNTMLFSEAPVYVLLLGGGYMIPVYFVAVFLCSIPTFIIQSFLGQFSASGLISVFRVAPIFKGIGYAMLAWNIVALTYSSILAAVPLVYATNTFHSVLPWMSCDNEWNTNQCTTHSNFSETDDNNFELEHHSILQFFKYVLESDSPNAGNFTISLPVFYGVVAVWILTLGVLMKRVSFIGKIFRCTFILIICLFIAIFAHLIIHMEISWEHLYDYLVPTVNSPNSILGSVPAGFFMAMFLMGPGLGHTIVLSSHNNFRRDSEKLTYYICITQSILTWIAVICGRIALDNFDDHVGLYQYHHQSNHFLYFLCSCHAYLFASFSSLPNLWSFLFFTMIFLAEISSMIIQTMVILTSIFDEYECLRSHKPKITAGSILVMLIISTYFCTKSGFKQASILNSIGLLGYTIINILLIVVASWVYGRTRFQCDLQFMLGKILSDVKIFLIRIVTPTILLLSIHMIKVILEKDVTTGAIVLFAILMSIIPAYMIYKVFQVKGSIRHRFRQCFYPRDWHPVDADCRRFYDQLMGVSEMCVLNSSEDDQI